VWVGKQARRVFDLEHREWPEENLVLGAITSILTKVTQLIDCVAAHCVDEKYGSGTGLELGTT